MLFYLTFRFVIDVGFHQKQRLRQKSGVNFQAKLQIQLKNNIS